MLLQEMVHGLPVLPQNFLSSEFIQYNGLLLVHLLQFLDRELHFPELVLESLESLLELFVSELFGRLSPLNQSLVLREVVLQIKFLLLFQSLSEGVDLGGESMDAGVLGV